jgi:hypothetical protein
LSSAFPTHPAHGLPVAVPLPLPLPDALPSQVLSYGPLWLAPCPVSELCDPSHPCDELPGPDVAVEPLPPPDDEVDIEDEDEDDEVEPGELCELLPCDAPLFPCVMLLELELPPVPTEALFPLPLPPALLVE